MKIVKKYKNYKGENIKVVFNYNDDTFFRFNYGENSLSIFKNDYKIKELKVKYDDIFWYKIQKTQLKTMNILALLDDLENDDAVKVARICIEKIMNNL